MYSKRSISSWTGKVVLMLAALSLFACGSPTDIQLVQTARGYLSNMQVREAAIELKNALQENPSNAEARYLLGEIYLLTGDMASAEKEFARAAGAGWSEEQSQIGATRAMLNRKAFKKVLDEVKVKDSYSVSARANLHALRAIAQAGLANWSQARQLLKKAIELDAGALYTLKASVQIYLVTGDLAGANKNLEQALAAYENVQELLLLSAIVAISNEDLSSAATAYHEVLALEPHKMVTIYGRNARLNLARLDVLNGNLDHAQDLLKPLFKQNSDDPDANFVGGLLAVRLGKLDLAENRLYLVLEVAPDHLQTQLLFGAVSYAQGDFEQAAYYISRYVSAEPDNLGARKLLGRTYIKLGQYEKVQTALRPALQDNRDDAELLTLVGLSQFQVGDEMSGIKGLEQAVKAAPENLALKSELAKAYIATGETENAVRALNAMLGEGGEKKKTEVLLVSAYIKAQQYSKAIDIVFGMLRKYLDDPAVLTLAGNVFVISNDRPEARKYFKRALQVEPGYVPATMLLARLEELDGRTAKAKQLYKKLAQTNQKDINSLMALARLAEIQKQPEDMANWLQLAGKRSPQDVLSRKALVEHALRENQLEKADLLLKEIIDIAPGDNSLLGLEARLQIAEGQYDEALSTLKKLVGKVPESVYARTLLAEVYFKLGQRVLTRQQLHIVLEKQPYFVTALIMLANLELQSGQYDKVLEYASRVQKVHPDSYMGYELEGNAYMKKEDFTAAKNSYGQAWQRKPLAGLAIKLSEASSRAGRFTEATKSLLAWLDKHPGDVGVLQYLAASFQNMDQHGKAIQVYEKVLEIQPDNVVVLNNLAWLYSLRNNPRALELAEKAHLAKPEDSAIQDTYGWALVQHGQIERGMQMLERAVQALPDVPEVQYHYAVALLKSGEVAMARDILGKLLEDNKPFEGRDEAYRLMR